MICYRPRQPIDRVSITPSAEEPDKVLIKIQMLGEHAGTIRVPAFLRNPVLALLFCMDGDQITKIWTAKG